ncbi:DUF58 domain-containing protein [Luteimonas pelagia]
MPSRWTEGAKAAGGAWRRRLELLARPRAPEALPVRLDRRRIYVLPTGFGLFFAVLVSAMLAGALNYNNNPAFLLALALAGAALSGLFQAHLQLSGLQVVAANADPVPAGTPIGVKLHFRGDDGRHRRGLCVDGALEPVALSLQDGAGEALLSLPTERRGWLRLPRLRISSTRPLGLVRAWSWVWPATPVLVYPRPEAGGPPLPDEGGQPVRARLHPAGEDVHHLRVYRRGDARRAIAWKPSAKRDQLLVREYEQPLGADAEIDWAFTDGLAYEDRIGRLARWVEEAERDRRRYRLRVPGQADVGPGRGAPHRHACLRTLATMPPARHGTPAR